MGNIDRQIANILVKIHREAYGTRTHDGHCRWYYSGHLDIYHCPHTAVYGKDVIGRLPDPFLNQDPNNPAQEEWANTPESMTHEL